MKKLLLALCVLSLSASLQSCCIWNKEVIVERAKPVEHIVFVWLKEGHSAEDLKTVIRESQALASIPGIKSIKVGRALESDRAIVDDSFQVGIVMSFDSVEEMRGYLVHPEHVRRVKETLKPLSSKILVYDILPE